MLILTKGTLCPTSWKAGFSESALEHVAGAIASDLVAHQSREAPFTTDLTFFPQVLFVLKSLEKKDNDLILWLLLLDNFVLVGLSFSS